MLACGCGRSRVCIYNMCLFDRVWFNGRGEILVLLWVIMSIVVDY